MPALSARPRRSRTTQILSTLLFVVAVGFAAAALWLMLNDDSKTGPDGPAPAQSVEQIDLAQVLAVVKTGNDDWDYSRNPASARSNQLSMPGQVLKLDDDTLLFVFIFTGASSEDRVAAAEQAAQGVDLATMTLSTTSGTMLNDPGQPLYMAQHSNVITVLVGGDEALAGEIQQSLDTLP